MHNSFLMNSLQRKHKRKREVESGGIENSVRKGEQAQME